MKQTIEFAQIIISAVRICFVILGIGSLFSLYTAIRCYDWIDIVNNAMLLVILAFLFWGMYKVKTAVDYAERAFDE